MNEAVLTNRLIVAMKVMVARTEGHAEVSMEDVRRIADRKLLLRVSADGETWTFRVIPKVDVAMMMAVEGVQCLHVGGEEEGREE